MATNSASVKAAAALVRAIRKATDRKWSFLAVFAFMFYVSVGTAASLDLLPEPQAEAPAQAAAVITAVPVAKAAPELPTRIEIPAIKMDQKVANPGTTNVEKLDQALLAGPVRYPSSSKLGETGTVIIFGHSSYLPIVNNKAFKAFDGIQDLKEGDQIMVTGDSQVYVYAVEKVEQKNAATDAIPLSSDRSELVLATCDSFGQKSDRFVVTAKLVGTQAL
jgi:LPXTG-site transpeptidase (sortase) family protein